MSALMMKWVSAATETHAANLQEKLEFFLARDNKLALHDLFMVHAQARGQLVETREEADTVFAWDGDITPYDITKINAEFIVD